MLQQVVHYSLHFLFPGLLAFVFFKDRWKIAWLIFMATMLVDLDHLWAEPIYELNRCSINFHPLHTYPAMVGYAILFSFKRTRLLGLGLLMHMMTDGLDCFWMQIFPK